jgi:hypothetical protein
VNKVDYDFGGKGIRLLRWAGREVGMRFYLLPIVQLRIALGAGPLSGLAHIGGPNFGLEASLQASVTASNSTNAQVTRACGVEGTIGSNMTLRLGSDKSKDLLRGKGVVDPEGIYSKEYPMGKCMCEHARKGLRPSFFASKHATWLPKQRHQLTVMFLSPHVM